MPQYSRFSPGSNDPVSHVAPAPFFQLSPAQLSPPGSPAAGTVYVRHTRVPVFAS